ncbi:MAG: metalloregulator ArsR/SmtB family transcription factor [bacterium]|nr:metalloregulator ArsR/SmtB family transcription factor [bacterium]
MLTKQKLNSIKLSLSDDDRLHLIFQALGDPGRFKIFKLLMVNNDLCVSEMAKVFSITASAASQQLRILERLNLIRKLRDGQKVCYEINKKNNLIKGLNKILNKSTE